MISPVSHLYQTSDLANKDNKGNKQPWQLPFAKLLCTGDRAGGTGAAPGWEPQTQSLMGVSVQVASLEETHGTLVREGLRWGEGDQMSGLPGTKRFPKMWDVRT